MNREQRKFLADKVAGTANIILGALAVSQFLTDRPFRVSLFFMGLVIYSGLLFIGFMLLKGGAENERSGN
jgi:hypothetical protein